MNRRELIQAAMATALFGGAARHLCAANTGAANIRVYLTGTANPIPDSKKS